MQWRKLGWIFVANGQTQWLHSHAAVPIARQLGQYRYRVYFSPRDQLGRANLSWLDIDVRDPTRILRLSDQPLISAGQLGCFDDNGAMGCWIVEYRGSELLYYQGWNLGVTVPFRVATGLAIRPAGEPDRAFERISEGPILDRCLEEPVFIACPAVLRDHGKWQMWYQSGRGWQSEGKRVLPSYNIGYAESLDGIHWSLGAQKAIDFCHYGEVAITRFCPLREATGKFQAWYCYRGNDWGYRIGLARSPDGLEWARLDDHAGIECDAYSWEAPMICYPYVIDTDAGRLMFYNGGRYASAGFGVAVLEQD